MRYNDKAKRVVSIPSFIKDMRLSLTTWQYEYE